MHRTALVTVWLVAVVLAGCARENAPPPRPQLQEAMQEIAKVYQYLEYAKLPPPKKPEDFRDYWDSMQGSFDRIQSGEIVVQYGVGRATGPGAGQQVLAYDKNAASAGGWVVLRDGTVKEMSAAEFAAAPKAK